MEAVPTIDTLLDEWRWRRDRLNRNAGGAAWFGAEQIMVLDYLIGRYLDSPEAQRPVRVMPIMEFHVDQRAIVVHHHLWEGKVAGIKTPQEAESRVSAIVSRMASHALLDGPETGAARAFAPSEQDAGTAFNPRVGRKIYRWIHRGGPPGVAAIAASLVSNPFLVQRLPPHLYERIIKSGEEALRAAELLVRIQNRTALNYAVHAWRELAELGPENEVWQILNRSLAEMEPAAAVAEAIRASLTDSNAQVRLAALAILARIGSLEDIGLLSDLLALPLAADEHPEERAALIRTMRSIAETTRGEWHT
jgi:hypothetical protein